MKLSFKEIYAQSLHLLIDGLEELNLKVYPLIKMGEWGTQERKNVAESMLVAGGRRGVIYCKLLQAHPLPPKSKVVRMLPTYY